MRFFDVARGDTALTIATNYASRLDALAARGARFVVLPEKAIAVTRETEAGVLIPLTNQRSRVGHHRCRGTQPCRPTSAAKRGRGHRRRR